MKANSLVLLVALFVSDSAWTARAENAEQDKSGAAPGISDQPHAVARLPAKSPRRILIGHGWKPKVGTLFAYEEPGKRSVRIKDSSGKTIREASVDNKGYFDLSPSGHFTLMVHHRWQEDRVVTDLELIDISGGTVWKKLNQASGGSYSVSDSGNVYVFGKALLYTTDGKDVPVEIDQRFADVNSGWSPNGGAFLLAATLGWVRCFLDNGKTAYTYSLAGEGFAWIGGFAVWDDCATVLVVGLKEDDGARAKVVSLSPSGRLLRERDLSEKIAGPVRLPISPDGRYFAYATDTSVHVTERDMLADMFSLPNADLIPYEINLPNSNGDLIVLGHKRLPIAPIAPRIGAPPPDSFPALLRIHRKGKRQSGETVVQRPYYDLGVTKAISVDPTSRMVRVVSCDEPLEIALDEKQ